MQDIDTLSLHLWYVWDSNITQSVGIEEGNYLTIYMSKNLFWQQICYIFA